MSVEQKTPKEKEQPRWKHFLVRYVHKEEVGPIQPVERDADCKLRQAVDNEIKALKKRIITPQSEIQEAVAGSKPSRPRTGREKSDIRRQLTSAEDLETYAKLRVLEGKSLGAIKVEKYSTDIIGVKPFKTKQQEWWKKVLDDEELTAVATENPERLERIRSAISLRREASNDGTMSQASKDFLNFINKAEKEDPDSLPYIIRFAKIPQR